MSSQTIESVDRDMDQLIWGQGYMCVLARLSPPGSLDQAAGPASVVIVFQPAAALSELTTDCYRLIVVTEHPLLSEMAYADMRNNL
ncbi:hypothetical protein P4O66_005335 [Electrophorus voltai]|uniref:Uncharacterized protein n=1 Tax=Electrophorus voltai TaxID=2609070 RepID=A0AAD9E747_9TELE|nr:hypothetical protein P4O66_005335 [Electrophorus voltai]